MINDLARLFIQQFSRTAVCITIALPISADAGSIGYVDYGPGDSFFEIKNGSLYSAGIGGNADKRIGTPRLSRKI